MKGVTFRNVELSYAGADARPALVAADVDGFTLDRFQSQKPGSELARFDRVTHLTVHDSPGLADRP